MKHKSIKLTFNDSVDGGNQLKMKSKGFTEKETVIYLLIFISTVSYTHLITVFKQAKKCSEMLDLLREHGIMKIIEESGNEKNNSPSDSKNDVLAKLKELADLKEAGILTDTEFQEQKAKLLQKL